MCGICGILTTAADSLAPATLERMTASLAHRGPDDRGVFRQGPIGLGHTRLSILDLSQAGHQPMSSEDGRWVLAYNGEVYNFPALREELLGLGVHFRGHSDTEVVLAAIQRWGTDALAKLNGMFALAAWDSHHQRLILARDRFGIKPLYYARCPGGVVFGSEIKAILASGMVDRQLDRQGFHEFLYAANALGENTLFQGIHKLLPGHRLTVSPTDSPSISRFRSIIAQPPSQAPPSPPLQEAVQRVRQKLSQAVQRHLVSDVPVGLFLSGGIDSSAIACLARSGGSGSLDTYSVGFDFDDGGSELPRAAALARQLGTRHHELFIKGGDTMAVIRELIRCHDQPFTEAANIPLYLLSRELKGTAKVVLQGDGGDELFAGYRRYNLLTHRYALLALMRLSWPIRQLMPRSPFTHRLQRLHDMLGVGSQPHRTAYSLTFDTPNNPPTRILSPAFMAQLAETAPFQRYEQVMDQLPAHLREDPLGALLATDYHILLPELFLEKVDRPTMAHGIEVRVPFLDDELADCAMALPSRWKLHGRQKKWILRQALRGIVPDSILDARKRGFSVPFWNWLKGPLARPLRETLLDRSVRDGGLFDPTAIETCIDEQLTGKAENGLLLMKLLNFALWQDEYLSH